MCIPAMLFWTSCLIVLQLTQAIVPSATLRSPYIQKAAENPTYGNYNWNRGAYYPRPSYVIYDSIETNSSPNSRNPRPSVSSTRPWHLEFSQKQNGYPPQPYNPYQPGLLPQPSDTYQNVQPSRSSPSPSQPVYSNLIQVVDKPQRQMHGPYGYDLNLDPGKFHGSYPRGPGPVQVPSYEVEYPYEKPYRQHFYGESLPDRFPSPFQPDKNFNPNEQSSYDGPRREFEFHRTQTVNYGGNNAEDRRGSRREHCNYIRVNEKGFPLGNELCGRSIADTLLPPDYPSTDGNAVEHRKRYRFQQGRSLSKENNGRPNNQTEAVDAESDVKSKHYDHKKAEISTARRKRSTQEYGRNYGNCCNGASQGYGYGYRPYYGASYYNDDSYDYYRRPYDTQGFDIGYGGQYRDNDGDDVGEETSDNHGLTSYLSGKRRGNGGRTRDGEENSSEEDSSRGSNKDGQKANGGQSSSKSGKSHNNRKDQSFQDNDRTSESRSQQHRSHSHRNFDDDDDGGRRSGLSGSYGYDYGSVGSSYGGDRGYNRGSDGYYDHGYGRNSGGGSYDSRDYRSGYGTGYGGSYGRGSYGLGSFGYNS